MIFQRHFVKPNSKNVFLPVMIIADGVGTEVLGEPLGTAITFAGFTGNGGIGYFREGASAQVAITAVAGTVATHLDNSWITYGAEQPATYQFCPPDACFVGGAKWVIFEFTADSDVNAITTVVHVDLIRSIAY